MARTDHFAEFRERGTPPEAEPQVDPSLEYDKYHITPGLVRKLEQGMPSVPGGPSDTMDAMIADNSAKSLRLGYIAALNLLRHLMLTQKEDQA